MAIATNLEISLIIRDPEIQPREEMNGGTITQYAEDMLAGIVFPAIRVFFDGEKYWLSQGFHRCAAAEQVEWQDIEAEVFEGTRDDAIWDAAGSNKEFDDSGMRRTRSDKKRAVIIALKLRPDAKSIEIADHVGCTDRYVRQIKESLRNSSISKPLFNETNEMVDWARWTWNPVTGCEHTCIYCYARDIANRFYAEKFVPTFHGDRLNSPKDTKIPERGRLAEDAIQKTAWRNVFVCSMADLFGRWVPDDWIESVFESCRNSPQWNYLFLTKFPQRYVGLKFPDTSWVGTTVDEQKRVANAEKAFRKIDVPLKWLSIEPMLEPIKFDDLSMFDWVVIGGQSRSSQAPEFFPDPRWVHDLTSQAIDAGCKVYWKENIASKVGMFKEYPDIFDRSE